MRRRSILAAALVLALTLPGVSLAQNVGQGRSPRSVQGGAQTGGQSSYAQSPNRAFGVYGLSEIQRERARGFHGGRPRR
jgi:hypothetical protein